VSGDETRTEIDRQKKARNLLVEEREMIRERPRIPGNHEKIVDRGHKKKSLEGGGGWRKKCAGAEYEEKEQLRNPSKRAPAGRRSGVSPRDGRHMKS